MFKIRILMISFFVLLLSGCSIIDGNVNQKIMKPSYQSFKYNGTWKIDEVNDLSEGELYTDEYKRSIIGAEVQIEHDRIKIINILRNNIEYKLKVVDKNYVISYEYNLTATEFLNDKNTMDIISVIDNNSILSEFYISNNSTMVMLYKSLIFKMTKVNDKANFSDKEDNIIAEGNYDILDQDVGVMIGIKKPKIINDKGTYSSEEYRTLWIAYKDSEVEPIYEKQNITFPRMNGIWQLSKKEEVKDNKTIESFEVSTLDGKVVSTNNFNISNDVYKSINFVGNDYLAIEKYEGNNFENVYNRYQIVPIDNINTTEGIAIDEIYSSESKNKFELDKKTAIANLSKEEVSMLEKNTDYSNITMARNEGKWILKGKVSPINNIGEGIDFNLSIKPNNLLINFNSILIPWKNLIGEVLFFKDAFTAPNNSIAIVQFKEFIAIYKIEDSSIKDAPIITIPVSEEDEIIMVEWCNGDYINQWQNAFKDGEIVR